MQTNAKQIRTCLPAFISQDIEGMRFISYQDLLQLAYDPGIKDNYSDYLHYVLTRARKTTGEDMHLIRFTIADNGCVAPFGEAGHPFCNNFYSPLKPTK
jgi:hypothetical protein